MDIILIPVYSIIGWFIFKSTKPGTIIYNKENSILYPTIDDRIIVKRGSNIYMGITYHNIGKFMRIKYNTNENT